MDNSDRVSLWQLRADWARVKCDFYALKMLFAGRRWIAALEREEAAERERRFNPYHDEAGRFTTADGAVAPDTRSQAVTKILSEPELGALLEGVAYPGEFHDIVRDYLVKGLRRGGSIIETEVTLVLPGAMPIAARLDIMGRNKNGSLFGIDVKTGDNPTFTPGQIVVYPHAVGGAGVVSYDKKIRDLGLVPGEKLPAFAIDVVYTRGYGQPMEVKPVPADPK